MARRRRRIEVYWENPPTACRALIRLIHNGRAEERHVGPKGRFSLEEAAAVLRVPACVIRRATVRGALRARSVQGEPTVTLEDTLAWWAAEEDRFDRAAAEEALAEAQRTGFIPYEQVRQRIGLR